MSLDPFRVRITEKRPFVRWAEKGSNGQNSVFRYINTPQTVIPLVPTNLPYYKLINTFIDFFQYYIFLSV